MNYIEFQDKKIVFMIENGVAWIAVKSVCEALNVNYNRQFQNIKEDPILGSKFAKQQILVPGDSQPRRFICLPEEFIYGWIFSIKSDSPELLRYKEECYHVLFHFFKGSITRRAEMYSEISKSRKRQLELEKQLSRIPEYQEFIELQMKQARLWKNIKNTSDEELSLF